MDEAFDVGDVVQGKDARYVLRGGGEIKTYNGRSRRRWSREYGLERCDINGFWTTDDRMMCDFPPSDSIKYVVTEPGRPLMGAISDPPGNM